MAKKLKSGAITGDQTKIYNLDKDAATYEFGKNFKSDSATIATGIDSAANVFGTTIKFGGKINLTAATATGIDLDTLRDSSLTVTKSGSIAASTYGIHTHSATGALTITNSGTISGTKGYGIHATNDGGLQGSLTVTNSKTIFGLIAGIAVFDDGAAITNAKTGTIKGTTGVLISDDNDFNDFYALKDDGTPKGEAATIITNDGKIEGGTGGWSLHAIDATVQLTNSGVLTGNVLLAGGKDIIINLGMITGDVNTGDGDDVVSNVRSGSINGDIFLGDGDDRFTGLLATGKAVYGGAGDDNYVFDTIIGKVTELAGEGEDQIVARTAIDLSGLANIEDAYLLGSGDFALTGNALGNSLIGNSGKNVINGADGDDHLEGWYGDDTLNGGNGDDELYGDDGDDILNGNNGDDKLYGGNGNDTLNTGEGGTLDGEAGNDRLTGGSIYSTLYGGNGDDILTLGSGGGEAYGDAGNDTLTDGAGHGNLHGGDGDDLLTAGAKGSDIYGDAGNDRLVGSAEQSSLFGGAGDDRLTGGANGDDLHGGFGNDTLTGGADSFIYGDEGNDTLTGGTGTTYLTGGLDADMLIGGAGYDRFIFDQGDSGITATTMDTISNFTTGIDQLFFRDGPQGDATQGTGNYVEGAVATSFATALTAANAALAALSNTTSDFAIYALVDVGTDSYLFIDYNVDGSADEAVKLVGVTSATFDASGLF